MNTLSRTERSLLPSLLRISTLLGVLFALPAVAFATAVNMTGASHFLADEWVAPASGAVTALQFETAWQGDLAGAITQIDARLYNHDPTLFPGLSSLPTGGPGSQAWSMSFPAASLSITTPSTVPSQAWIDNWAGQWLPGDHTNMMTIGISGLASGPSVVAGNTYWLALNATVSPLVTGQSPLLGWNAQTWNMTDGAVYEASNAFGWRYSSLTDPALSHGIPSFHNLAFSLTVPEPAPLTLLAMAALGSVWLGRRR